MVGAGTQCGWPSSVGSELLIYVPRAAHSHHLSLSFVAGRRAERAMVMLAGYLAAPLIMYLPG